MFVCFHFCSCSVLQLVGGVVLGLGIYAHVTDFITGLSAVVGSDLFRAGSILIIVAGALMVVISFLGCCGAWQENRIMLGMVSTVRCVFLLYHIFVMNSVHLPFFSQHEYCNVPGWCIHIGSV